MVVVVLGGRVVVGTAAQGVLTQPHAPPDGPALGGKQLQFARSEQPLYMPTQPVCDPIVNGHQRQPPVQTGGGGVVVGGGGGSGLQSVWAVAHG